MLTTPAPDVAALAGLVAGGGVVVLSGAGLSTESGIPDYRGPSAAATRRLAPMTHQAFVGDPVAPGGTVELVYTLTNFNHQV